MNKYHIIIYTDVNLDDKLQEMFYGENNFRYMSFVRHVINTCFATHYHIYLETSDKESLFDVSAFPLAIVCSFAEESEVLLRVPMYSVEKIKLSKHVFYALADNDQEKVTVFRK